MGFRTTKLFCQQCGAMTTHMRPASHVSHELHGLLSLVSCGLWLPIYGLLVLRQKSQNRLPYVCGRCGQRH